MKTYGATLKNGAASLSYGSGTITGDVTVDVQTSSLGVYALIVPTKAALDANSALALAKTTFPLLAGLTYTPYTVTGDYAWYATGSATTIDPKTREAVTTAQAVLLYILPDRSGQASVTATVGRGQFAASVIPPAM